MKKLTAISAILLSSLTAAQVMAAETTTKTDNKSGTEWFMGAGIGYQNDHTSGLNSTNGEDISYEIRGGAIFNENHRVMATYGYMDKLEQNKYLASYDYLMPVGNDFKLFGGATLGASDSEMNGTDSTDFVWGAQVGAMYEINKDWSTELSYRFLDQDFEEQGMEIKNSQQVMLTVDYRF